MTPRPFRVRREAGEVLAGRLQHHRDRDGVVVPALPQAPLLELSRYSPARLAEQFNPVLHPDTTSALRALTVRRCCPSCRTPPC